ncbi:MAG: cytochrome C assembly family protein [bacterium]
MTSALITYLAAALYTLSGIALALRLFSRDAAYTPSRSVSLALGIGGVLLHTISLYGALFTTHGVDLSFFNAASSSAWVIVLLVLVSSLNKPVENLGILLFPVTAAVLIIGGDSNSQHILSLAEGWALPTHVLISLLAYSLLAIAAVQAILLAIQDRQLHRHHPGGFVRVLPPLQTMESLLFEMIGAGFLLLTVSLATGFIFLDDMFAQKVAHKTVLSIIAWVSFGILLWGRFQFGWRGRTAIKWTLAGFGLLMLAYFGSKAVLEFILA